MTTRLNHGPEGSGGVYNGTGIQLTAGDSFGPAPEAFSGDLDRAEIEMLAGDTIVIPEPHEGYVTGAYSVEPVPHKPADEEGGAYESTRFRRSRHHRTVTDRIVRGLVAIPVADMSRPYEAS